ncbi:hypothetical protein HanXRQr2_Chr07g0311021 [Helianthus annuus]|uniref:Uncharacterized protein n=1 Tax=Helianthus annuus TaxID=4232 RepID=A0A9K3NHI5_HELAN|nr:hypothetical protein HanXRQr2_Chr07g0311021 [Helianthus annuus]
MSGVPPLSSQASFQWFQHQLLRSTSLLHHRTLLPSTRQRNLYFSKPQNIITTNLQSTIVPCPGPNP